MILLKIIVSFHHHFSRRILKKGKFMNRSVTLIITLTIITILFIGCVAQPQLSPAQKRQITSKLYEADYELTFRAILTVIQDQGYIIKNTDMNTGLINATIDRESEMGAQVAQALILGYVADKGSNMEATFMVNKINDARSEVRVNLQEAKYGQANKFSSSSQQSVKQILDPGIYEALFNEIEVEINRVKAMNG